jgi:hypothetical protein
MRAPRLCFSSLIALLALAAPAFAQDEPADVPEEPKKDIRYGIGIRGRGHAVPPFGLGLFYDVHPTFKDVLRESFGAELIRRKGDVDLKLSFEYANYKGSPDGDLFLNRGDDVSQTEIIDNSIEFFSADFSVIGSSEISRTFRIIYGGGLGAGLVKGQLVRTDTFTIDPNDPAARGRCTAVDGLECQEINLVEDRVPPVAPVLNMLLGARLDFSENVSWRLEGGFRGLSIFAGTGFDFVF